MVLSILQDLDTKLYKETMHNARMLNTTIEHKSSQSTNVFFCQNILGTNPLKFSAAKFLCYKVLAWV